MDPAAAAGMAVRGLVMARKPYFLEMKGFPAR